MKKLFLISIYIIYSTILYSQNNVTSRLRIYKNNDIPIIFNGIKDFKNGIVLNDFTILKIYFNDTVAGGGGNPAGTGWELDVRADNGVIWSASGSTSLALNTVEMRVNYDATDYGPFILSNIDQEIATGIPPGNLVNINKDITISYDCGTHPGNKVTGYTEKYFIVNLIFTLKPKD